MSTLVIKKKNEYSNNRICNSYLISDAVGKSPSTKRSGHGLNQKSMQSYELFNPETEDVDTDSSGLSTPDSVGSVISVKLDSTNGTPQTGKCLLPLPALPSKILKIFFFQKRLVVYQSTNSSA